MYLKQISANAFRLFNSMKVALSPHMNIFFGDNGEGKTSLLESVAFLAGGSSFRTSSLDNIISFEAEVVSVWGEVVGSVDACRTTAFGVERRRSGGVRVKAPGGLLKKRADLARILPYQLLNVDSLDLVSGDPSGRRKFLDWLVFHVEPDFYPAWKRYNVALKQRNAFLKTLGHRGLRAGVSDPWIGPLEEAAAIVQACRESTVKSLTAFLTESEVSKALLDFCSSSVRLDLECGWNQELGLAGHLEERMSVDLARGATGAGPHRADIRITTEHSDRAVRDIFSRGQIKRLVCALFLARAYVLLQETGRKCLFLVDDVFSELDSGSAEVLLNAIADYDGQALITCLDREDFLRCCSQKEKLFDGGEAARWFHVEHGNVFSCQDASVPCGT